jgi:hypothetical protein
MARVMRVAADHGTGLIELLDQAEQEPRRAMYVPARLMRAWRSPDRAPAVAGFYLRRTRTGWITRDWWDAELVCWRRTERGVICANQSWPWAAM